MKRVRRGDDFEVAFVKIMACIFVAMVGLLILATWLAPDRPSRSSSQASVAVSGSDGGSN